MLPAKRDLHIMRHGTYVLELTWEEDDEPVDLTGYDIRMAFADTADSAPWFTLTPSHWTVSERGEIRIELPPTVTSGFTSARKGVYDLLAESPAGVVTFLLEGPVHIHARVTQ